MIFFNIVLFILKKNNVMKRPIKKFRPSLQTIYIKKQDLMYAFEGYVDALIDYYTPFYSDIYLHDNNNLKNS